MSEMSEDLESGLARLNRATIWHEFSTDCWEVHCVMHGLDEVGSGYRRCGECGHLYDSARELRRLYRRGYWEALHSGWVAKPFNVKRLWHLVTIRASRIAFCQLCMHDF